MSLVLIFAAEHQLLTKSSSVSCIDIGNEVDSLLLRSGCVMLFIFRIYKENENFPIHKKIKGD